MRTHLHIVVCNGMSLLYCMQEHILCTLAATRAASADLNSATATSVMVEPRALILTFMDHLTHPRPNRVRFARITKHIPGSISVLLSSKPLILFARACCFCVTAITRSPSPTMPCERDHCRTQTPPCQDRECLRYITTKPCHREECRGPPPCHRNECLRYISTPGPCQRRGCPPPPCQHRECLRYITTKPCHREECRGEPPCEREECRSQIPCQDRECLRYITTKPCQREGCRSHQPCDRDDCRTERPCQREECRSHQQCDRDDCRTERPCQREECRTQRPVPPSWTPGNVIADREACRRQ